MSAILQALTQEPAPNSLITHAKNLLSQQIWCWGRDIQRVEGNWLTEIGFERIEPPSDREGCHSVYSLKLPDGQCIVLRGYGLFYENNQNGGIFVPRYEFLPYYTKYSELDCQPWTKQDLGDLDHLKEEMIPDCVALLKDLIDWIQTYEEFIVQHLGIEYRRKILGEWDNGERLIIPAEEVVSNWQSLSLMISKEFLLDSSVF